MRRDKLFGNMFMRLAACALMSFTCAVEAWGGGFAKTNPEFLRWQKIRRLQEQNKLISSSQNRVPQKQRKRTRLLSTVNANDEIEILEDEDMKLPLGHIPSIESKDYLRNLNFADLQVAQASMGLSE